MLLEFYGLECEHCIAMQPLVERLEKEEGVKVDKTETWHSEVNEAEREKQDRGRCGGVPFFLNTETDEFLCGESTYEELKSWALGSKMAKAEDKPMSKK